MIWLGFLNLCVLKAQEHRDFYSYTREMDQYYYDLSTGTPDSLKVPGMKEYLRWKDFWQNRIYNSAGVKGDMDHYGTRMMEAINDPDYLPDSTGGWAWQFVGPDNLSTHNRGIISSLYVNPENWNEIYAGSNSSGMFRTFDGGNNWECITDNLGIPAMGVNDIAVNYTNQDIKYLAVNPLYRSGPAFIYKTIDNCKTWQKVFSPPAAKRTAIRVALDPVNPDIVYAAIHDVVYRSMDAGVNWKLIFNALTYSASWYGDRKLIVDIEFKPGDPGTCVIASTGIRNHYDHEAGGELWITRNAKDDSVYWQRIEDGLPEYCDRYALAVHSSDPATFFIGFSVGIGPFRARFAINQLNFDSFHSENVFEKEWWQNYGSAFSGMGYWCTGMEFSPTDPRVLFIGGYSIQALDLESKQFIFYRGGLKDKDLHVDQRVFKVVSDNGKTCLFSGNDGGISRLEYETGITRSCNGKGLNNVQYYGIGHSESDPGFMIGGTQDNGVFGNGNGNWNVSAVGDAYEVIVDPVQPENVYITATGGSMFIARSVNHGKTFYNTPQPFANGGINHKPFLMSPSDRKTLYVGYNEVFMSPDQCISWQQISDFHNPLNGWNCGDAIGSIGITAHNPDVIYVGFINPTWGNGSHRLFLTSDRGVNWIDLTDPLSSVLYDKGITGIAVSPADENKLFVTFNGYAKDSSGNTIHKVLCSHDAGISWSDVSATLPDLPVNCITGVMIKNEFRIVIGNDLGIFLFDELNGSWQNISQGLPFTIVSDIEFNQSSAELIAGTFGRGIWKSGIPDDPGNKPGQNKNTITFHRVLLSPNPAGNSVSIELPAEMNIQQTIIKVLDIHGHVIIETKPVSHHPLIDTSDWIHGLYLLQLSDGKIMASARLLKI